MKQHTLKAQYLSFVSSVRNLSRDVERNVLKKIKANGIGDPGAEGAEDAQVQELKKLQKDMAARIKNNFKGGRLEIQI